MSIRALGGNVARCPAVVLHSGYDNSAEGQKRKRERDKRLLELELAERPEHPFVLFNLGMTAHYNGEQEDAIVWLERSIKASEPHESHVRKAYALKAGSQRALGGTADALATAEEGLRVVEEDPELRFLCAVLLTDLGRLEEAKAQYLAIDSVVLNTTFSSLDKGILGVKRYHNLGAVCAAMGQHEEAQEWWSRALTEDPRAAASRHGLFQSLLATRKLEGARQLLEEMFTYEGPTENWTKAGGAYSKLVGGVSGEEGFYRHAIERSGRELGPRRVYARWLLEMGREAEAVPILRDLDAHGCAEGAYLLGVHAIRRGNRAQAKELMRRALTRNPEHIETASQLAMLEGN